MDVGSTALDGELSDTKSLCNLNTRPPRNHCTFLCSTLLGGWVDVRSTALKLTQSDHLSGPVKGTLLGGWVDVGSTALDGTPAVPIKVAIAPQRLPPGSGSEVTRAPKPDGRC